MKKPITFTDVKFLKSASKLSGCPPHPRGLLAEGAVIGRSNVGKSSLLNTLFRKKIAKTSATPGKTQLLNFFSVDEQLFLVDLPGYGFARVSQKQKEIWNSEIEDYLWDREELKFLIFLVDVRHPPNKLDQQMYAWILERNLPTILVLTKCDKLSKNQLYSHTKKIQNTFDEESLRLVHYSSISGLGRQQLISAIQEILQEETTV
jgi:GTP-binding protein